MLPAANRGVGMNIGFPDVCLTPAGIVVIPIPYPNFGMLVMAMPFSVIVRVSMVPALNIASAILVTMGDEGGVAHPMIKQRGMFMMGHPIVHVQFLPAICLLCPTTGNNFNNPLGAMLVPCVTIVFYSYTGTKTAASLTEGEVSALARATASAGREGGPPVRAWMSAPGVGALAIDVFSADVPARVVALMRDLEASGMERLVLDLRGNPGGDLKAAAELAGDFLEAGTEIGAIIDGEGDEEVLFSFQERPYRAPLTVLIDGRTASAAELVAGSLKAHGRAVIAGERSFGKAVVSQVVSRPEGGAALAPVARFRLPGGGDVQGVGVTPDRALGEVG